MDHQTPQEIEDLGTRKINGTEYYVTRSLSGEEHLTSIKEANLDGRPALFRLREDLANMSDADYAAALIRYPELKELRTFRSFRKKNK